MNRTQKCLAVIRIRGTIDIRTNIQDTMRMLNLNHNCNATLIDNRPSYQGMLKKAQSYVTWGEPTKESIALLLKKRGRTKGNKVLTEEHVQEIGYNSLEKLAESLHSLKVELKNLVVVKPIFRLHPPRKGYKRTVKKNYQAGGKPDS